VERENQQAAAAHKDEVNIDPHIKDHELLEAGNSIEPKAEETPAKGQANEQYPKEMVEDWATWLSHYEWNEEYDKQEPSYKAVRVCSI